MILTIYVEFVLLVFHVCLSNRSYANFHNPRTHWSGVNLHFFNFWWRFCVWSFPDECFDPSVSLSDSAHWRHGERDRWTSAGVWGQKPQTVPSHRLLLLTRAERRRQAGCHGSALIYMQKLSRDVTCTELGQDCNSGAGGHVTLSLILFTVNTNLSSATALRSSTQTRLAVVMFWCVHGHRMLNWTEKVLDTSVQFLTCSAANKPISDKTLRVNNNNNNNKGFLAFKGCVAAQPYLITFKQMFYLEDVMFNNSDGQMGWYLLSFSWISFTVI